MGRYRYSYILVGVQFVCLVGLALSGPLLPSSPWWGLLMLLGMLLGGWAVLAMRIPEVSVLPEVREDARLVTRGPYRIIRHPMYSGLLVLGLGLVMSAPSPFRWALWLALLANLMVKLNYEERLLEQRFSDYREYQSRTWRILPFVY